MHTQTQYHNIFVIITLLFTLSAFTSTAADAQSSQALSVEPDTRIIVIGPDAPDRILMGSHRTGEDIRYEWDARGSGMLEGDFSAPAIFYKVPDTIEQKLERVEVVELINDKENPVVLTLLDPSQPRVQQDFGLTVVTDKARYSIGDQMTMTIAAERACDVYLFVQDEQGTLTLLELDYVWPDHHLQAGEEHSITVPMRGPAGKETVIAIAGARDPGNSGKLPGVKMLNVPLSEAQVEYEVVE